MENILNPFPEFEEKLRYVKILAKYRSFEFSINPQNSTNFPISLIKIPRIPIPKIYLKIAKKYSNIENTKFLLPNFARITTTNPQQLTSNSYREKWSNGSQNRKEQERGQRIRGQVSPFTCGACSLINGVSDLRNLRISLSVILTTSRGEQAGAAVVTCQPAFARATRWWWWLRRFLPPLARYTCVDKAGGEMPRRRLRPEGSTPDT